MSQAIDKLWAVLCPLGVALCIVILFPTVSFVEAGVGVILLVVGVILYEIRQTGKV